jgi:hypothetical protein
MRATSEAAGVCGEAEADLEIPNKPKWVELGSTGDSIPG